MTDTLSTPWKCGKPSCALCYEEARRCHTTLQKYCGTHGCLKPTCEWHNKRKEKKAMTSRTQTRRDPKTVYDLESALEAAGLDEEALPSLKLTIEVEYDGAILTQARTGSFFDDPVEILLDSAAEYGTATVTGAVLVPAARRS